MCSKQESCFSQASPLGERIITFRPQKPILHDFATPIGNLQTSGIEHLTQMVRMLMCSCLLNKNVWKKRSIICDLKVLEG